MNYEKARDRMVTGQLMSRGIKDPLVLGAFRSVRRERFVTEEYKPEAYEDHPLPIGSSQTISQPYMVAVMTELLELKGGEKVLEIGTGSGYQSAILSEICDNVFTVENKKELYYTAMAVLLDEGYDNVFFKHGDGTLGWQEEAPFDSIIVTAASPDIPHSLQNQLKNGGKIVIPVGPMYTQMLVVGTKKNGEFITKDILPCVFVPLVGFEGWQQPY